MSRNCDYREGEKRIRDSWSKEETRIMIKIWAEFKNKLEAIGPKKVVWNDIQTKLKEMDIEKTIDQIKSKLKNLKTDYKRFKPGITGSSPSNWPFYEEVHEILKSSHYFNPEMAFTIESDIPMDPIVLENENQTESQSETQSETQFSYITTPINKTKGIKRKHRRIEELRNEREEIKNSIEEVKELTKNTIDKMNENNESLKNELSEMRKDISNLVQYLMTKNNNQ